MIVHVTSLKSIGVMPLRSVQHVCDISKKKNSLFIIFNSSTFSDNCQLCVCVCNILPIICQSPDIDHCLILRMAKFQTIP